MSYLPEILLFALAIVAIAFRAVVAGAIVGLVLGCFAAVMTLLFGGDWATVGATVALWTGGIWAALALVIIGVREYEEAEDDLSRWNKPGGYW